MRSNLQSLRKNKKAASPAVSAVIITAATVVLVIISSLYALQVLTRQEAQAEFETAQNSILAFDDAVRDIAWDRDGSRSIRFTAKYGNMRLINDGKSFSVNASGFKDGAGLDAYFSQEFSTSVVKYQMPNSYGLSGSGSSYILGDGRPVVSTLSDSFGQALLVHESEITSIALNYRVRVSEGGAIQVGSPSRTVNYVDIFVIRLISDNSIVGNTDFDLVCKNVGLTTSTSTEYTLNGPISIAAIGGNESDTVSLTLAGDSVVFNMIIAEVRVST
jgi:hypothetical protein